MTDDSPVFDLYKVVVAVWEKGDACGVCEFFHYGPGGPDPCVCEVLDGDVPPDYCPGVEDPTDLF